MPEAQKVAPKKAAARKAGTKGNSLDADRFIAEILAHRHTGKLADLITAILKAAGDGPSSLRWQIKLDPLGDSYKGRRITEDSISLTAVVTAERAAGHTWKSLSPTESAADCHALIVGWLIEDEGLDPFEAQALVRERVTLDDVASMVGTYEVGHGPKEVATHSAPTSG